MINYLHVSVATATIIRVLYKNTDKIHTNVFIFYQQICVEAYFTGVYLLGVRLVY